MGTTFKKLLMTTAGLVLLASPAAYSAISTSSIIVDGRADLLSQSYNDDASTPAVSGGALIPSAAGQRATNNVFQVQYFRADFMGKIGEENTYRFRMAFANNNKTVGYPGPADNISSFFDLAFVAHKFTPELELTAGKTKSILGGWSGFYDPQDAYNYYNKAFLEMVVLNMSYLTGAVLKYDSNGQFVRLQVADVGNSSTVNGGTIPNNAGTFVGANYRGKFMGDSLQPNLGYGTETIQNQTGSTANKVATFMNASLKYTIPVVDVEADYLANSYADLTTVGQTDSTNTLYVLARYKMDGMKPFAAYEMSTQNVNKTATQKQVVKTNAFQLGVEYYPKKDENFRYHLVYTNSAGNTDLGTGAATTNQAQQQIVAGIRFAADLLK